MQGGGDGERRERYGGGSAAQSSLFQFCDVVLGVRHGESTAKFVREMRAYMPGAHRRFLEDVEKVAEVESVRRFVVGWEGEGGEGLKGEYGRCLEALKAFRQTHIAVVTRFIVLPSKVAAKEGVEGGKNEVEGKESEGTGGAPLIPFLKMMRDETTMG